MTDTLPAPARSPKVYSNGKMYYKHGITITKTGFNLTQTAFELGCSIVILKNVMASHGIAIKRANKNSHPKFNYSEVGYLKKIYALYTEIESLKKKGGLQ